MVAFLHYMDPFELNIEGVRQLIESDTNKVPVKEGAIEGVSGEFEDALELDMTDEELLILKDEWEQTSSPYDSKIKPRQEINKLYYNGKQRVSSEQQDKVVSSNLIFEAEETFIPQALSKNPEPVVWSDNTEEGKLASNDVKTMLQYHADTLCLRAKLGMMVRHWSIYFIGVVKHGWDDKVGEIKTEIRKPQKFVLDPDGYIDEYGNYVGAYLGERMTMSAKKLIKMYPEHEQYILLKVDNKLGTRVTATEWWTDEYSFVSFEGKVLDKFKNPYFNYGEGDTESATPAINHFAAPKMPYTFLSVFSLQEQPHDITNLIEQSIPNQDRINDRDTQISKNLRTGNNSIAVSGLSFTVETAHQAAIALEDGDPVLVPDGQVENAIKRIPANALPAGILQAQENDKITLRSVFGTLGLSPNQDNRQETARGQILDQSHDASRIGGGIGDRLEQVADNIFNWWAQLYCVFYDVKHYGAIMGSGRAVEYVGLMNTDFNRKFVISVSPDSMQPKDETSEQNLAVDLANKGWLDPINLFKKLNYPDPMETAKMVTLFRTNPQVYMQTFFAEAAPPQPVAGPNPPDLEQQGAPADSLSAPPASPSLSQVPIGTLSAPQ